MTLELIRCDKWKSLADHVYDYPDFIKPTTDGIVYCSLDHIDRFFRECGDDGNTYVVISSNSDYGLCYQHKNPVWLDMRKWFDFQPLDETLGYSPLVVPARCCAERCKISDKYSVKMHVYTTATFDKVPENILRWYSTNCDVLGGPAIPIPFGIPEWSESLIQAARDNSLHRRKKVYPFYLNFQNNTAERVALKKSFAKAENYMVVMDEIPHEEYINNLLSSYYVVAPCGNGLDSYRVLESIYCGATPIITNGFWSEAYKSLPAILVESYHCLPDILANEGLKSPQDNLDGTIADFGYWRKIFEREKNLFSS